jgi:predicted RND superfamily exporter protein
VKSLAGAFVVVFVMMALLFRSALYGVLAMLPLTITIAFIYGLIGWTGKDYDMPIAVLSALTLGLSVDFAIHFLERAREAVARSGDFRRAMAEMFEEPARAIARNAIVIAVGFTPLLVAPLVPYVTVGVFLASIMAVSALVTLVLLPAAMRPLADRMFRTPAATVEVTSS